MKTDRTIVPTILNHFDSCTYNIFITFFLRLFCTIHKMISFFNGATGCYGSDFGGDPSVLWLNIPHVLHPLVHPCRRQEPHIEATSPICSPFFGVSHFETKHDSLPHAPLRSLRFLRDLVSSCGAHQNGTQKGL